MDQSNKSSNRSFGVVFFIVFLIISLYPILNYGEIRVWALIISSIFLILGLVNSKLLSPLNIFVPNFGKPYLSIIVSYSYSRFFGLCQEIHRNFFKFFMTFLSVAPFASSNNIAPTFLSTIKLWNNMIHRKVRKRKNTSTILTGVFISPYNISSVTGHCQATF